MSCCLPPPSFAEAAASPSRIGPGPEEVRLASRPLGQGLRQSMLSVPDIHCGACVKAIETALGRLEGIESARVNLSSRRVTVRWREDGPLPDFVGRIVALGYRPHLFEPGEEEKDATLPALLRALAVAAFASMNIMMLSGSVWSGADAATRDVLHWICAALTLPALLYSGRVFYVSAFSALRHGRTNMDVPISVGVLLAFALSLYDTLASGEQVYFDAVASLIFFLLIGRTLDHVMRARARTAVAGLARIAPRGATVLGPDGRGEYLALGEIGRGAHVLVPAGERVPLDGVVVEGRSEIDRSLISGESAPVAAVPGSRVEAGTLNLAGPLTIAVTAEGTASTLAEMLRLMEAAESGRSGYRRIADRAAELYSPVVHLAALLTFGAWMLATADAHQAITTAIAVLIITCPCALGLAVPMVHVMAARRLFEAGIMVKDGAALERLAEIDRAVFDKTGTLSEPQAALVPVGAEDAQSLAVASALARRSRHPQARAIAAAAGGSAFEPALAEVCETAGAGIEARVDGAVYRLGRADWAAGPEAGTDTVLARDGAVLVRFALADRPRPGAAEALAQLRRAGIGTEIVSGDAAGRVAAMAERMDEARFTAGARPADKIARIAALRAAGHRVLMVGDGLNDAPALAAADVSMAPADAAEIGRNAADFVFLRPDLRAVPHALGIARQAARLVRQNLWLAMLYNLVALPAAALGHVTPFWAAIAMSASSIAVVLNALRLGWRGAPQLAAPAAAMPEPAR